LKNPTKIEEIQENKIIDRNWTITTCLLRDSKLCRILQSMQYTQSDTKERELLKSPTKIEEIQEKKFIDRNWTITTCLLRDSILCRILQSMQHTQNDKKERELLKCVVAVKECIR